NQREAETYHLCSATGDREGEDQSRQDGEQRARSDDRPLNRSLAPGDDAEAGTVLSLPRDPQDHRRETPAQPEGEAEQMEEEPKTDHGGNAERMAPSIGWRPAKPLSVSCQWVMRSSPSFQQRRIGRSSRSE